VISQVMTQKRFEAIVRCFHLVDNTTVVTNRNDPGYDKIAKVRWLVENFVATAQRHYNSECICIVDEMMIPYKGRYSPIQQYMKAKPNKWGIKAWALAKLQSRFVTTFISRLCLFNTAGIDLALDSHGNHYFCRLLCFGKLCECGLGDTWFCNCFHLPFVFVQYYSWSTCPSQSW
jgi:hypothetical protein